MAKENNEPSVKELIARPVTELQAMVAEKTEALTKARFKHALRQLKETHTLRVLRRQVARLKTAERMAKVAQEKA